MRGPDYFVDRTCCTAAFNSASEAVIFGCVFPSLIFSTSFASAAASSLYFAATSLYAGPTFFLSTSWQFKQPLAFSTSAPDSAYPVPVPSIAITPRTSTPDFMNCSSRYRLLPMGRLARAPSERVLADQVEDVRGVVLERALAAQVRGARSRPHGIGEAAVADIVEAIALERIAAGEIPVLGRPVAGSQHERGPAPGGWRGLVRVAGGEGRAGGVASRLRRELRRAVRPGVDGRAVQLPALRRQPVRAEPHLPALVVVLGGPGVGGRNRGQRGCGR